MWRRNSMVRYVEILSGPLYCIEQSSSWAVITYLWVVSKLSWWRSQRAALIPSVSICVCYVHYYNYRRKYVTLRRTTVTFWRSCSRILIDSGVHTRRRTALGSLLRKGNLKNWAPFDPYGNYLLRSWLKQSFYFPSVNSIISGRYRRLHNVRGCAVQLKLRVRIRKFLIASERESPYASA